MAKRRRFAVLGGTAAVGGVLLARRAKRQPAYPPGDDAIGAEQARDQARGFLARSRISRRDLALSFAPSVATSIDPLLHGRRYFPRMLEDLEAARDHVHLLIYGYKPGDIGSRFRDALAAKVREGVEVRLEVDAVGSEVAFGSRELFADLRAAGVDVAANYGLRLIRRTDIPPRRIRSHAADFLHFDHRKMAVIDGRIGYVGGSGIEDHYTDERFYDVMCRLTGPVVAQLQLVFLASWRYHEGRPPADGNLGRYFPADAGEVPADAITRVPATLLWNVPGSGHHPISDAIELALAEARTRIDIVNPYISNRAILEGILAAARRGVQVRLLAPGKPTPPYPAAAFRHWYDRLLDAGTEILLHPEMAHAKVLRIDDRVFIGGCNLDDLSLFRNDELDVMFEDAATAELVERQVFDELVAMSTPAERITGGRQRAWNAAMARVSRLL